MNSANKGFCWERKLAKALSLWVSNGKDQNVLWRQGGSGGRATILKKKGAPLEDKEGDIILYNATKEGELFIKTFFVEAKCVRGGDLFPDSAFFNSVLKYINKAKNEAKDKVVLLIIKQNYKESFVVIPSDTYFIPLPYDVIFPDYSLYVIKLKKLLSLNFISVVKSIQRLKNVEGSSI